MFSSHMVTCEGKRKKTHKNLILKTKSQIKQCGDMVDRCVTPRFGINYFDCFRVKGFTDGQLMNDGRTMCEVRMDDGRRTPPVAQMCSST